MKDIELIKKENTDLKKKLEVKNPDKNYEQLLELKETLDTFLLAHKNCRSRYNMLDRVFNIGTLFLTCATSYLLTSGEGHQNKLDMILAFTSAVTSGITNYLNSGEKAGEHTGLITMYTELINKIIKTLNMCDSQTEIDSLCMEYYERYIELNNETVKLGLIDSIRRRYDII